MDIGVQEIVDVIIQASGEYLVTFSPIIVLVAGLVLAFAVIERVITSFFGNSDKGDTIVEDSNVR